MLTWNKRHISQTVSEWLSQKKGKNSKLLYLETGLYLLSVLVNKILSYLQECVRITKADKTFKCGLMVEII